MHPTRFLNVLADCPETSCTPFLFLSARNTSCLLSNIQIVRLTELFFIFPGILKSGFVYSLDFFGEPRLSCVNFIFKSSEVYSNLFCKF